MSSSFGLQSCRTSSLIARALRSKKPQQYTPPTWYQKNALMYGQYEEDKPLTNLPPVRLCNVHEKGLFSSIMQKWIRFKVSSAALREIDRKGGLDEYILKTSLNNLGGESSVGGVFRALLEKELDERKRQNGIIVESDQNTFGDTAVKDKDISQSLLEKPLQVLEKKQQ